LLCLSKHPPVAAVADFAVEAFVAADFAVEASVVSVVVWAGAFAADAV